METSKFRQVVLPVLLAAFLSFMVLMAVVPTMINEQSTNEYTDEWPDREPVNETYEPQKDLVISNTSIEDYIKEDMSSPEEVAAITELTLQDIYNVGEDEGIDYTKLKSEGIILDLSQLSHFPNLISLTIEANDLGSYMEDDGIPHYYSLDSKSLAKLSKLEKVTLKNIRIDDLNFLHNSGVTTLAIESCDFKKLSKEQYEQFKYITTFTLGQDNTGVNFRLMFHNLSQIKELDVGTMVVSTIEYAQLDALEKLTFVVSFNDTRLYEPVLKRVPNVKKLTIRYEVGDSDTKYYELTSIKELTKLEELYIQGDLYRNRSSNDTNDAARQYHDYSFLKSLTNLKSLTLQNLDITDLDFLKDFTKLTYLDLSYNYIEDISDLSRLRNLEKLNLSFNFIHNIDALAPLTNLTSLSLGNNLIDSIEAIRNMKQLTSLEASSGYYRRGDPTYSYESIANYYYNNEKYGINETIVDRGYHPRCMEDVLNGTEYVFSENSDFVNEMGPSMFFDQPYSNDVYVTLCPFGVYSGSWANNRNRIEDLSPVSKLDKLLFLDVGANSIKDLSPIKGLHKLQFLGCMDNKIEDVSCITYRNFPNLNALYLSQNPFHEFDNKQILEDYIGILEYYMTPYYNSYYFDLVEDRDWPVTIELTDFDIVGLYSNAYTGRE